MKTLTLIGSIVALAMSVGFARAEKFDRFEFPILIVLATLGMMLMVSANSLLTLYMGLELQSLALYVVAAINRDSVRSTEAGLKYFVLGALSSGMMLYGISLIYGFTGHIELAEIAAALTGAERSIGVLFGLVFLISGLAFKISAVPFHMWTPDVYEGAPTPGDGLLRRRAENGGHGDVRARRHRRFRAGHVRLAADRRLHLDRLHGARRLRGNRPAQHQAPDGLFLDRSHGLRAGRPVGRHAEGVKGVIIYMTIYLAMTLGTFASSSPCAARTRAMSRASTIWPACRRPIRSWRRS
jgi:NADH-quinone oxidoreductase subunit N